MRRRVHTDPVGVVLQREINGHGTNSADKMQNTPAYLAQREHIYDGMRLAGVPEE